MGSQDAVMRDRRQKVTEKDEVLNEKAVVA
jgi:hypothetical protein